MYVIVCGSRTFTDAGLLAAVMDRTVAKLKADKLVIVTGAAKGADELAERWALARGYTVRRHHPDWKKYGKAAGMRRSAEMVAESQALVAFWDGESPGTEATVAMATRRGLKVKVVRFDAAPAKGRKKSDR